ncbi:MAG: anaerobic ribonucleoside-triphosphate reductase activating protein [Telluria sp.]|nr:anaerobic ribonucleoside-triphosphate reductase activating protein [Telluria sp.]
MSAPTSTSAAPPSPVSSASRELKVGGITAFSATDYPGKLAAVVFVQGCPWRCGYCHNPHLQERTIAPALDWGGVMALLRRRVGLIDAVVFSGGEPCTDPALGAAIAEVRALGFAVGLHSAGVYPRRLAGLLPLLDWVGFDVKAPFEQYEAITGVAGSGSQARECAELILASGVDYECRTTIHPTLLAAAQVEELAATLAEMGVRNYALQVFRAQGCADSALNAMATAGYPGDALLHRVAGMFGQFTLRRS